MLRYAEIETQSQQSPANTTVSYMLPLDMLNSGEWADIAEVEGDPAWVTRLAELGVSIGSRLRIIQAGSPCLLEVANCRLCLRNGECSRILVRPIMAA